MLQQPEQCIVCFDRGKVADRSGAAVFGKTPLILKRETGVFSGNQLGIAGQLGVILKNWKALTGCVAQSGSVCR